VKPTRAVFLDRDGVLNALVVRDGIAVSPRVLEDFAIVPDARASVARLKDAGFRVFVITNQPDIARGLMSNAVLDEMLCALRAEVPLDDIAVCTHDDADGCSCRKPRAGMLHTLAQRWQVDLRNSVVVGDSWRDMHAGRAASCKTVLLGAGKDEAADYSAASLGDAVDLILTRMG
jgi:D-glycero-D-manno-heptose 1,7-bisphosphate phosphatase